MQFDRPLRLLFVIKSSALARGFNTGMENLAWRLAARGVDVTIISGGTEPVRHGFVLPPGVTYRFTGGDGYPGDHLTRFRELTTDGAFHAVIGWLRNLMPLAANVSEIADQPLFIANECDLSVSQQSNGRRRRLGAALAELFRSRRPQPEAAHDNGCATGRITGVGAISRAVQMHATGQYGIPLERTTIIPRGIDTSFFRPSADRDYRRLATPPRLLFTGNIVKSKGVGDVVDALASVSVPVEFVVCGRDSSYRRNIEQHFAATAPGHRLTWAGALDHAALREQLHGADIFMFCSWREGLGKSLLEAMACGLPVIVSDIEAFRDLVDDGVNGQVTAVRDPRSIARAIDNFLADPAFRASCGRAARRTVEVDYSVEQEVDAWLAYLARQLGSGRTQALGELSFS